MGKVIGRSASSSRIKEVVERTVNAATARGGEVANLAQLRIVPILTALESNEKELNEARANDDTLHATLLARDAESDLEIATILDEINNTLGRPGQSIDYDLIASGGKKTWTEGDPAKQPYLMGVLASNIRNTKHPKLADKREDWAARIENKAAAQAEAARPTEASYARVAALGMQRRGLACTAQLELTRFKRDLKNLGMTEAQAHEIIPDTPRTKAGPGAPPAESAESATE